MRAADRCTGKIGKKPPQPWHMPISEDLATLERTADSGEYQSVAGSKAAQLILGSLDFAVSAGSGEMRW